MDATRERITPIETIWQTSLSHLIQSHCVSALRKSGIHRPDARFEGYLRIREPNGHDKCRNKQTIAHDCEGRNKGQ
jgi:hypothetical protein